MKKLFVLMAACAMFAACSSPASKAVDYMEDCFEATKAGDYEKAEKLTKEYLEWEKTLTDEEKKEAQEAIEKWAEENADKF
ncbi:MAG: hypothetical protein IJ442_04655 [Bacteroidaceae bacterium]|nr:hypothetical protein [Alistipes sp.]MBQ8565109.1 hypothetical protein [Bacteroidaceae bacterium]